MQQLKTIFVYNNPDVSHEYYVERRKPDTKEYIQCDSIYRELWNRHKKSMVMEIPTVVSWGRCWYVWKGTVQCMECRKFLGEGNAYCLYLSEFVCVCIH